MQIEMLVTKVVLRPCTNVEHSSQMLQWKNDDMCIPKRLYVTMDINIPNYNCTQQQGCRSLQGIFHNVQFKVLRQCSHNLNIIVNLMSSHYLQSGFDVSHYGFLLIMFALLVGFNGHWGFTYYQNEREETNSGRDILKLFVKNSNRMGHD